MNMSPLQRKFVIKQRIYSISVTLSRLILFLGFIGIWEFTADKGIYIQFTGKTVPDIYGPRQRRNNIHAYMGNSL